MKIVTISLLSLAAFLYAGGAQESTAPQEQQLLIGISKIVAHPALDDIERGLIEVVSREHPQAVFDQQNAQGDVNTAVTIAQRFLNRKVNLAVGIATPTAIALVNKLPETPIVFSGVTDPVSASLLDSWEGGDPYVTGISDLSPVAAQFATIDELLQAKKVGIIYNSGEINSQVLAEKAEQEAGKLGINLVRSPVTNSAELSQATRVLMGEVDALYLPTDNTVYSGIATIDQIATANKVPIFGADISGSRNTNTLLAMGVNYYKMGLETGAVINQILAGTSPADIPIQVADTVDKADVWLNLDAAQQLGITFPASLQAKATYLVENGSEREAP